MNKTLPWEPQPGESNSAYGLFRQFLALPIEERSVSNFIKTSGTTSKSAYRYSSKHNWLERSKAYESAGINQAMEVRATGQLEFQEVVIAKETEAISAMSKVIMKEWENLQDLQGEDTSVSPRHIVSLTNATQKLFDMTRRAAGLPISYKAEFVDEYETEQEVFIIGED